MKNIIVAFQIIVSILLILSILAQSKGTGLGAAWGGSSETFDTRRGTDKLLFNITIVLAILFLLVSAANLLVK